MNDEMTVEETLMRTHGAAALADLQPEERRALREAEALRRINEGPAREANTDLEALLTIMRHRAAVSNGLEELADELNRRSRKHDLSKLRTDEFYGYVMINKFAQKYAYGSDELKKILREDSTKDLHFSRNSHHPEHHNEPYGGEAVCAWNMGFLDIIEMVIDWQAASLTYGKTPLSESLPDMFVRFDFTEPQKWLIHQVVEWVTSLEG